MLPAFLVRRGFVKIPAVVGECKGCFCCMMTCPMKAIGPLSPKTVNSEKCRGCGKCVEVCPAQCRVMEDRTI